MTDRSRALPRVNVAARQNVTPAQGFNFTLHMRTLCDDMAGRLPELGHMDLGRVAIRFCQATQRRRGTAPSDADAVAVPGRAIGQPRRGRAWTVERLYDASGRESFTCLAFICRDSSNARSRKSWPR